jgi:hypothetical protein
MLWRLPLALDPRFRGDDGGESGDDGRGRPIRLYVSDALAGSLTGCPWGVDS